MPPAPPCSTAAPCGGVIRRGAPRQPRRTRERPPPAPGWARSRVPSDPGRVPGDAGRTPGDRELALPGGKAGSQPHACPERRLGSHRFCLRGCVGQGDRPHGPACPRELCGLTPPLLPIPSEAGNSSIFHHTAFQPAFCLLFPARPQQWALSAQRQGASPKDGHCRPCRQRGDVPAPAGVPHGTHPEPPTEGWPWGAQEQKMGFVRWGSQVLLSLRHHLARGSAWRQERPPVTHLHPNARHPKALMSCDGTAEVGLELIWHTARAGGTPSCHLSTSFPHHPEAGSCALAGSGHLGASLNWHQDAAVALQLWGAVPGSGWSPRCCPSPQSQCSKRGPRTFLPGLGGSPGRAS